MRGVRKQLGNAIWLGLMITCGLLVGGYLLAHQRVNWPTWTPGLGKQYFYVNAEFTNSAGVLPGQGNAVTIAGVKVGEITGEEVKNGRAVLKLRIDHKYGHVHPDATLLLRPKTALKDMVAELDPGRSGHLLRSGDTLPVSSTNPDVNFDEILSGLDGDTRAALVALLQGAGTALGGNGGRELASTLKRFEPLSRHAEEAQRLVAQRRVKLRKVMGNLSLLAQELGARDKDLGEFVNSSAAVFRHFTAQNDKLGETLSLLPTALKKSDVALGKLDTLSTTLKTGLKDLAPGAKALGPSLRDTRPFFKDTTPVIRDSLRPFAHDAKPVAAKLVPTAGHLAKATPDLDTLTKMLNNLVAELAHDPPGNGVHGNSYLYYVPWAGHNTNSVMASQDGIGPVRHTLVLFPCGTLDLLGKTALDIKDNPTLATTLQLLDTPPVGSCGAGVK
ncbi:MlaD family protein [Baekduia sp.]|jgi:phospholipid/cholesterol/gamma-HCH transport system substrate-binding protein|uniref:MlaD family protein n=1 Tax=Baekduia sp. TaxID=2600305 RepID=UPI002E07023E|nr:MlaD family protein [Baekduia sp.]